MRLRFDEARMLLGRTTREAELRQAVVTSRVSQSIYQVQLPNGQEVRVATSGKDGYQPDQPVTIARDRGGNQWTMVTRNPEGQATDPGALQKSKTRKRPVVRIDPTPITPDAPLPTSPLFAFDEATNRLWTGSLTFATVSGDGSGAVLRPVISGGLVSSIDVVRGGADYTAATVTITGSGKRAKAHATIVSGEITAIVMDDQGGGYNQWRSREAPEYFEVYGFVNCGAELYAIPNHGTAGGYYRVNPTTLSFTWIDMTPWEETDLTGYTVGHPAWDGTYLWSLWEVTDGVTTGYRLRAWLPDGSADWHKNHTLASQRSGIVINGSYAYAIKSDRSKIIATSLSTGADTEIALPTPPQGTMLLTDAMMSNGTDVFFGMRWQWDDSGTLKLNGELVRITSTSIVDEMPISAADATYPGPSDIPTFYGVAAASAVFVSGQSGVGGQYPLVAFADDGGWAYAATGIEYMYGMCLGADGYLYVTDANSGEIRAVDPTDVATVVSNYTPITDGSPALGAVLYRAV